MATLARRRTTTHARHSTLEQLLLREERVLRYRRQVLRDNSGTEVTDAEERSQEEVQLAVGSSLAELASRTLQGIEDALHRHQAGVSGTCSDCGGRIAAARRRALPFATQCRPCREVDDRPLVVPAADRGGLWPASGAGIQEAMRE